MKKKMSLTFLILFIFGVLALNSCYTKKKGIVPCPRGYNDINIENINEIPTEKV